MKIYIVRHGETRANEEGRFQGWTNDPLNAMGIKLAEETGRAMEGIKFDAAFSSSLLRAEQTAKIILKESSNEGLPIKIDDRIKEISMGSFEGKKFKTQECEIDSLAIKEFFEDAIHAEAFPNGESVREVMIRTQEFLKELASMDYETVLVATHGCALRCMLNFLYEDPNDFWHGHVPYNCCVNIVNVENGQLSLIADDEILYDTSLCVDRYANY